MRRILFSAGASGGHLYPGIAVADELSSLGVECHFLCGSRAIEAKVLDSVSYTSHAIDELGSFAPLGLLRARAKLRSLMSSLSPDAIVACGGRSTILPALIAHWRGIPLFLLEQNRVMGKANRFLRRHGL